MRDSNGIMQHRHRATKHMIGFLFFSAFSSVTLFLIFFFFSLSRLSSVDIQHIDNTSVSHISENITNTKVLLETLDNSLKPYKCPH